MPLPQGVIEQLGRAPVKTPGWSTGLLMFGGSLFIIALVIYLGLILGYRPYLNSQAFGLNDQIQKFAQQIPAEDQTKIIVFYSQLINLKKLLSQHVFISPLFEWLEKNTLTSVYYTKFNLDIPNRRLNLAGSAKTVDDFAKQVQFFNGKEEIQNIVFNNVTSGQDKIWQFDLTMNFNPEIFKKTFEINTEKSAEETNRSGESENQTTTNQTPSPKL